MTPTSPFPAQSAAHTALDDRAIISSTPDMKDGAAHSSLPIDITDTVVAVFANHEAAESAIKKLAQDGIAMKHLTVIGKGYHTEEKVVGFYNIGDRVKFWGGRGAFWGGLWGLFFGGLFLTVPLVGPVIILGYTASIIIAALENAVLVGGISALGAALYSIGIPKDSVIQYEADIKAERFVVMVHGAPSEIERAKAIMSKIGPTKLDIHTAPRHANAKA